MDSVDSSRAPREMSAKKSFLLSVILAGSSPLITIAILVGYGFFSAGPIIAPNDSLAVTEAFDLAKLALGFVDTLDGFLLGSIGAAAVLVYRAHEKKITFGRSSPFFISLAIGFLFAGMIAGYSARAAGLRSVADSATLFLDQGEFHIASTLQAVWLLLGVATLGIVFLKLSSVLATGEDPIIRGEVIEEEKARNSETEEENENDS